LAQASAYTYARTVDVRNNRTRFRKISTSVTTRCPAAMATSRTWDLPVLLYRTLTR
jgi:GTP cyclohydrolase FolE2